MFGAVTYFLVLTLPRPRSQSAAKPFRLNLVGLGHWIWPAQGRAPRSHGITSLSAMHLSACGSSHGGRAEDGIILSGSLFDVDHRDGIEAKTGSLFLAKETTQWSCSPTTFK